MIMIGTKIKALIDFPDGGAVRKGEIGTILEKRADKNEYIVDFSKRILYLIDAPLDTSKYAIVNKYKKGDIAVCLPIPVGHDVKRLGEGGIDHCTDLCFKITDTSLGENYEQILWVSGLQINSSYVRPATEQEILEHNKRGDYFITEISMKDCENTSNSKLICYQGNGTLETGSKIIKALEDLGGVNTMGYEGKGTNYYYIRTDNVIDYEEILYGYTLLELPKEPELNTYGLHIGMTLKEQDINNWQLQGKNYFWKSKGWSGPNTGCFVGDRKIEDFKVQDGIVGFLVSDTHGVYLKAEGFSEFINKQSENSKDFKKEYPKIAYKTDDKPRPRPDIIQKLEELGGNNYYNLTGKDTITCYYISNDGSIKANNSLPEGYVEGVLASVTDHEMLTSQPKGYPQKEPVLLRKRKKLLDTNLERIK